MPKPRVTVVPDGERRKVPSLSIRPTSEPSTETVSPAEVQRSDPVGDDGAGLRAPALPGSRCEVLPGDLVVAAEVGAGLQEAEHDVLRAGARASGAAR